MAQAADQVEATQGSYPIAGNFQANVGRCMEAAPIPRPMSPSRAGLRDRDARLAQIVERSSPAYGVFDPEVKLPRMDAESELHYFKEELERYAGEIRRLQQEVSNRDQDLARANEEIRRLKLGASLEPTPAPSVGDKVPLFVKQALQNAASARGGHTQMRYRSTRTADAHADPRMERLDELSEPTWEDPKPIRSEVGHHRCWGASYNPANRQQTVIDNNKMRASAFTGVSRPGAPYRRLACW